MADYARFLEDAHAAGTAETIVRRRAGRAGRPSPAEVTDIIPIDEFGPAADLDEDLDYGNSSAFDREARVIRAPELDDLHDCDDLVPLRLDVPAEFAVPAQRASAQPASAQPASTLPAPARTSRAYRDSHTDVSDGTAVTDVIDMSGRRGLHRRIDSGHVKGRLVAAAMAVGATAAAAYSLSQASQVPASALAAPAVDSSTGHAGGSSDGIQVVSVAPAATAAVHSEELANGAAFAAERAEREARLSRPLFVMPTRGVWTSGFGYRWGVLHGGIDIANAIGTPIVAASDGVVIDVGPTAGYGAWVKLLHSDGTVTLYGHVNTWTVSKGQRVMAGDQIATIGNRGNSTGPHCHFEVLLNGTNRVDPVPWLAKRGLSPGRYVG